MQEYIWVHNQNINYKNYPHRDAWREVSGSWEFPIDRFNILDGELSLSALKNPFE